MAGMIGTEKTVIELTFRKNLKHLVTGRLHSCIGISSGSVSDENPGAQNDNIVESWIGNGERSSNHSPNDGKKSSIMSPKLMQSIERWTARTEQEIVSTFDKQRQEAELSELSNFPIMSSGESSFRREEGSQDPPVGSVEIPNLGASSLVQIWEKRLTNSNSMKSRSNSENSSVENGFPVQESSAEAGESVVEEKYDAQPNDDPFPDWESGRTSPNNPPSSSQGCSSEGESEKVRIVDIIKRLTAATQMQSPRSSSCGDDNDHEQYSMLGSPFRERECSYWDPFDYKVLPQVFSPRIRGRQAFTDLLMQLERDRQREIDTLAERRAVSRFTQRGRIQSLIRLRLLQRGIAIQDQPHPQPTVSEVNKLPQGSNIMHLRERFSTGVEQVTTAQNDATYPRSPRLEMVKNAAHLDSSCRERPSTSDEQVTTAQNDSTYPRSPPRETVRNEVHLDSSCRERLSTGVEQVTTALNDLAYPRSPRQKIVNNEVYLNSSSAFNQPRSPPRETVRNEVHLDSSCRERLSTGVEQVTTAQNDSAYPRSPRQKIVNNEVCLNGSSTFNQPSNHFHNQEVNITEQHSTHQLENSMSHIKEDVHEEARSSDVTLQGTSSEFRNLDPEEFADRTASFRFWAENEIAEEVEVIDHDYADTSYDWINDIARPRSYWEHCRQERYEEVLNNSGNGEICQLLERRTVSSFLTSDFRERIDRLMVSHLDRQVHLEEREDENGSQEGMDQFMSFLHSFTDPSGSQEEEVVEEEEEEDRDVAEEGEESLISGQCHEAGDYFDESSSSTQIASPYPLGSWSYQDNQVGDDSDQVTSTSPRQHLLSQPYYQDSQQNSSATNPNSIEMELIYDMRGQMEQLYHEMSELRKSIKSCMDMQMMLQQSSKQESHSAQGEGKKSYDGVPKKGNCCICYEKQIDSLLYRCGHMCTCLKCAHELQWGSGKCPICRAPIVDVVRAYVDS
ncbi:uncharacterized protein LOC115968938 isoform X2 [Quercus lobata]|uniref:uncharacterized protein LOC115968938 isoform X2 n=1 Tax=Quercus lobata TaxID=97700 RepID=UPI001248251A|nr:uncharacterized protein LOC115968938 isoform X2 [Quercus lobata]